MDDKEKKKQEVKHHPLNEWINENCQFVTKLKVQMTTDQCNKIIDEFKDKTLIADTLLEMDNYKPLTRRYQSVYLTLRNWLKRNVDLADNPPLSAAGGIRKHSGWTCTYQEALSYLERKKIPLSELEKQFLKVERAGDKPIWRKL